MPGSARPGMPDTLSLIRNQTEPQLGQLERTLAAEGSTRPAWVIAILASVLIFTTVVDVLGNLLVIISVFRNRKLRNSGRTGFSHCCHGGALTLRLHVWLPHGFILATNLGWVCVGYLLLPVPLGYNTWSLHTAVPVLTTGNGTDSLL